MWVAEIASEARARKAGDFPSIRRKGHYEGCKGVNAQDTSAEPTPDLPLQIAQVLLIDVVGYPRLLVNEQIELLQASRPAGRWKRAGRFTTGDGWVAK